MPIATPPQVIRDAITSLGTIRVTTRVDIYESDADTIWQRDVPVLDWTVNADYGRDERRNLDLTLSNGDGTLPHGVEDLWYDKVIKVYRGVELPEYDWEAQLGEFYIDVIDRARFPKTVQLTCRDGTKRLMDPSKFKVPTSFTAGQAIEEVVRAIANGGGVTRAILPITGQTTGKDFFFDKGTVRWDAIKQLVGAYGYECFFDPQGYLVMQPLVDPYIGPTVITLTSDPLAGNLVNWSKRTGDSRLYNVIAVEGGVEGQVPVYAQASNTNPSSPSNVARIGERVFEFKSSFIATEDQAQDVADKFLPVHALEEYELPFESVTMAWLDVGTVAKFEDPDPDSADPDRFLLSSLSIPRRGAMSGSGKRVVAVG